MAAVGSVNVDYILLGLMTGAIMAITGFLLYEYGGEMPLTRELQAHSGRQRLGAGLMVGAVLVWLSTALGALLDIGNGAGLAFVVVAAFGGGVLAWWVSRSGMPDLPVLLPRLGDRPASRSAAAAYLDWPVPVILAEAPVEGPFASLEPLIVSMPAGEEPPVELSDGELEEVDDSVPEPEIEEVEAAVDIAIEEFESPILAGVDGNEAGDDSAFASALLSDIVVSEPSGPGSPIRSLTDRILKPRR